MLVRPFARLVVPACFALACLALTACESPEYAVLLTAESDNDIDSLDVLVLEVDGGRPGDRVEWVRGRTIRRTAQSIQQDPLRIAVTLPRAGEYMVHVTAVGQGRTLGATRCYTVNGVERDAIALVDFTLVDEDRDGFPDELESTCVDPADGLARKPCVHACPDRVAQDCDDTEAGIFPGAPEVCEDGLDQDCDGDPNDPCADSDGDGFPACGPSADPTTCDCDDQSKQVHPGADDICGDGFDQDCDGREALCDVDGDGYFADRLVGGKPDCNDDDPNINPGAAEKCTADGEKAVDENCNGLIDELEECTPDDLDRDGYKRCTAGQTTNCDCNDCNGGVNPGVKFDLCGNGIDEDCNGQDSPCAADDVDQDNYGSNAPSPNTDCNDVPGDYQGGASPRYDSGERTYPGAPEVCGDGIIQDCTRTEDMTCSADADNDGYDDQSLDCDPTLSGVNPGAVELCNDVDDNCNGVVNEIPPESIDNYGCGIATGAGCNGSSFCPIDYSVNFLHCGGCGSACSTSTANRCASRACACGTEAACAGGNNLCCGTGTAASCTDTDTDRDNCGGCGRVCSAKNVNMCAGGECVCGNNWVICSGTGTCSDPTNARTCGAGCTDCTSITPPDGGSVECSGAGSAATCVKRCGNGKQLCGNKCVDANTDSTACGASCMNCGDLLVGAPAGSEAYCDAGTCRTRCPSGTKKLCGSSCVNTNVATCPVGGGTTCNVCSASLPNHASLACGGASCDFTCDSPYLRCGSGCFQCPATPTDGTVACNAGNTACVTSCNQPSKPDFCGNLCTNTQTDAGHCGSDCLPCGPNEVCEAGICKCGATAASGNGNACAANAADNCCDAGNDTCDAMCN